MTGERIGVPAAVLYAGVAALVALLIAVGFLAGRASTAVPPAPAHASQAAPHVEEAASAPGLPPFESVLPDPASPAPEPTATPATAAAATATLAAEPAAAPVSLDVRDQVAEYFRRMDATQSAAKTWSDPNALAQEIMAQATRGDSSGFDRLIAASAAARDGVRGLVVPPTCAEHHDLTLALLDDSVRILTRIRDGVASGDTSALASLSTSGSALESRARAVDELGASLRARYGVEGTP